MGMLLNTLLSPTIANGVLNQQNSISYTIRNVARISGESAGLPRAIPDNRKFDYLWRDFYFVAIMAAFSVIGIKVAETLNVVPSQVKLLGLNTLKDTYKSTSPHQPAVAKLINFDKIPKGMPPFLRDYFLGDNIKSHSYELVPELLHTKVIPELKKATHISNQQTIHEAELIAHHLQRIFSPEDYIDRFLLKEGQINKQQAELLKSFIPEVEQHWNTFTEAQNKGDVSKLKNLLSKAKAQYSSPHAPSAADTRTHWIDQWIEGSDEALRRKLKGYSLGEVMAKMKKEGYHAGKRLNAEAPILRPDTYLIDFYRNVLKPHVQKLHPNHPQLTGLLKDLVKNRIRAFQVSSVVEASKLRYQTPIGVLLTIGVYGLAASYIDVHYVQPFQDQVVKLRGSAKETQLPVYAGFVAGAAAFGLLMANPLVRKMGHLTSFLVSFAGFQVGQLGVPYIMVKRILTSPLPTPKNKKNTVTMVKSNKPNTPIKPVQTAQGLSTQA